MKNALLPYGRLVTRLAREYWEEGLEIEDLVQEANLAILEAETRYVESMGVAKKQFLRRRVRDRLRTFKNTTLNRVEVGRYWEAVSIAGGPSESLRAKDRDTCEALRVLEGKDRFKKPRRVEELAGMTPISLDAEAGGDETGEPLHMHEVIGVSPTQEGDLLRKRVLERMGLLMEKAAKYTRTGDTKLPEIVQGKFEGRTSGEIAAKVGLAESTVDSTWSRIVKRVAVEEAQDHEAL